VRRRWRPGARPRSRTPRTAAPRAPTRRPPTSRRRRQGSLAAALPTPRWWPSSSKTSTSAERRQVSSDLTSFPLPLSLWRSSSTLIMRARPTGRDGDDEGAVRQAAARRGHVGERKGRMHRARHLQRHHQPLR
jgi:hypothetical protein